MHRDSSPSRDPRRHDRTAKKAFQWQPIHILTRPCSARSSACPNSPTPPPRSRLRPCRTCGSSRSGRWLRHHRSTRSSTSCIRGVRRHPKTCSAIRAHVCLPATADHLPPPLRAPALAHVRRRKNIMRSHRKGTHGTACPGQMWCGGGNTRRPSAGCGHVHCVATRLHPAQTLHEREPGTLARAHALRGR